MECDIIYVETKTKQLGDMKEIAKNFFIVTKKGFIPIKIFNNQLVEKLGDEIIIKECHIDHNGKIIIDEVIIEEETKDE